MSKGVQNRGAGTASLALVRGFLLSRSWGYAKAAPLCPGSSSSPPGHQQALVTCRASTLSPYAPSSLPPPEGPLSGAALAAQLSSTLGTLSAACPPSPPPSHRRLEDTSSLLRGWTSSSQPLKLYKTPASMTSRAPAACWTQPWRTPSTG